MIEEIEDILNETADKLNAVIEENNNISFMVIAVDCQKAKDEDTRQILTSAKCGGTSGALAAGLIATAVQTKGGKQVFDAIRKIMEIGCFNFENVEEMEN